MQLGFFRCPRSGQGLREADRAVVSRDGRHCYDMLDGIPDFYVEDQGSATPADDANRKWLSADAVAGRELYYERCREWEGMSFCVGQIARLSHSECCVLEVGAGTGHFSRWLAERCDKGTRIYCFDFSWPCIEMTRARTASLLNVHLFRANARGPLPFAAHSFDVILQRLAPFSPKGADRGEKNQRSLELLKPGGHHIFAGWDDEYGGSCEDLLRNGWARAQHHRWEYPYRFEDEEYVGGLMEGGASRQEAEDRLAEAEGDPDGLTTIRKEHLFIAQKPEAGPATTQV